MTSKKLYVFLDRDGTIIEEKNYLSDPNGVQIIPGVVEGLKSMIKMRAVFAIFTNQSGIGRGYYGHDDMVKVNDRMLEILKQDGIDINHIYHCPHAPKTICNCRKPLTGMYDFAQRDLDINTNNSELFMIGDKECDIDFAHNIGAKGILVLSGFGKEVFDNNTTTADFIAKDMKEAANWISTQI